MSSTQQLLTIDEAADRLNVSVRFMRRLVAERRMAYVKVGKYIRFDPMDLDKWVSDRRIDPRRAHTGTPKTS